MSLVHLCEVEDGSILPTRNAALFGWQFCRLRLEVEMLVLLEPFEQRISLRDDLTNYCLNSLSLTVRSVNFLPVQPSISGTIRGVWPKITS